MSEMDMMAGGPTPAGPPMEAQAPNDGTGQPDFRWEEQATPEEQEQYEQVLAAISKALYSDDKTFEGFEQMLQGDDPVDSLVRATTTLISEVDKKIQIPEVVIPQLPMRVFDMLLEVGTKAGFFELTDEEIRLGAGAAQDTVNRVYGISAENFEGMTADLNEQDVEQLSSYYDEVTNGHGFSKKGG
jgi:hypothetical protein